MNLDDISALSILIPLISAVVLYRRLNKTLKLLGVFILFSAITESLAAIYFEYGWNNMIISHLYAFVQVPLLAWVFSTFINGVKKRVIFILCGVYLLFSVLNVLLWEDLLEFNSNQRYFAAVVIISYCLFYYTQIFVEANIVRIELEPNFWISSSILLYTAGTLFLFIYNNELMNSTNQGYWNLNCILNIILNIGLTGSLWMGARKLN